MKKRLIPVLALMATSLLASCGGSQTVYDLKTHLADGELGYVILVGEDNNPEAEDRTKGCIAAMEKLAADYGIKVNKLEQTTSTDGSQTWSDTQAKVLVENWVSKHGKKLDFIVSNNDGMAIAAASAKGLEKKTPIIGFDALSGACKMIKDGELAGSVSQNGTDQSYAVSLVLSALINGKTDVEAELNSAWNGKQGLNLEDAGSHIIQSKLSAVTAANADELKPGQYVTPKAKTLEKKKILWCVYNAQDTFIGETYKKDIPHYVEALGGEIGSEISADDSPKLIEAVRNANSAGSYDGYAFNIIEHSTYRSYLEIAGYKFDKAGNCTEEGKPVVFYNRQPKNDDGKIADLSKFSKVYYVGSGSKGQGEVQGQVITDWAKANVADALKTE